MGGIAVIATSRDGTRAALRLAADLSVRTLSKIWLFVRPGQISSLPDSVGLGSATVLNYEGRETDLPHVIPKANTIVLGGGGGRWWPTPEQQLARRFATLGYRVVFTVCEISASARATGASSRSRASGSGDT